MNKMHGKGTLYYGNGQKAYEGEWFEDMFDKFGHYYNSKPKNLYDGFNYKDFA